MVTRITVTCLALMLVFVALGGAFQTTIKTVPPNPTDPTSGKAMFMEYCAVCHGQSGKGDGPAAPALKKKPADLTQLAAHNAGKFPDTRVARYIQGEDAISAHGSREMPVWGDVFKGMSTNRDVTVMRVANLTRYVESLQATK